MEPSVVNIILATVERIEATTVRTEARVAALEKISNIQQISLDKHIMRTDVLQDEVKMFREYMMRIETEEREEREAGDEKIELRVDELEPRISTLEESAKHKKWTKQWHRTLLRWGGKALAFLIVVIVSMYSGAKINLFDVVSKLFGV